MAVIFDNALDFFSRSSDVLDYNSNYTFQMRVKIATLGTFDGVWVISDGTANNRDLVFLDSAGGDNLVLRAAIAGAATSSTGATVLTTGVWYDIVIVRAAVNDLKLYLNGAQECSVNRDITGRTAATIMHLSRDQSGNALAASYADMKVWAEDIGASRRAQERGQNRPKFTTNIYGWWPVLSGADRAKDFSGKGRDWTENGTLTDEQNPAVTWGGSDPVIFDAALAEITGNANFTFGAVTTTAAATNAIVGDANFTFGAVTTTADATNAIAGAANFTLSAVTTTASATNEISGAANFTFSALTLTADADVEIAAAANFTLGAVTLSGAGAVSVAGAANFTFGAVTLTGEAQNGEIEFVDSGVIIVAEALNRSIVGAPLNRLVIADELNRTIASEQLNRSVVSPPVNRTVIAA